MCGYASDILLKHALILSYEMLSVWMIISIRSMEYGCTIAFQLKIMCDFF